MRNSDIIAVPKFWFCIKGTNSYDKKLIFWHRVSKFSSKLPIKFWETYSGSCSKLEKASQEFCRGPQITNTTMVLLGVLLSSVVVITYFLVRARVYLTSKFLELSADYVQKSYYNKFLWQISSNFLISSLFALLILIHYQKEITMKKWDLN